MTKAEADKSQGRRAIAAAFLKDAQREATPWRSRADFAFEAVYLYALAAIRAQADEYEHPDARVLSAAAETAGLTALEMEPAVTYITQRYDPVTPENGSAYGVLISIAEKLAVER
jgi:hypothetical protein